MRDEEIVKIKIEDIKNLIIKLDVAIDAEHQKINGAGLNLLFDFTEEERKKQILEALNYLNQLQKKEGK